MDVRLPDGTIVNNVPEGTSKADLFAKLKANGHPVDDAWLAIPKPAPKPGFEQMAQGEALDTGMALLSGAVAAPIAGLAGLVGAAVPGPEGQGAEFVRKTQEALTYEPRTAVGKAVTGAISYPFEKLAQGAEAAGGKVAEATGSPAAGAAVNTAIQAVPMLVGKVAAKVAPGGSTAAQLAKREAAAKANALFDAQVEQAHAEGWALPPAQVRPTYGTEMVEGIGNKAKTEQVLSVKNQPKTNEVIRRGLGIEENEPMTPRTFSDIRRDAGRVYEEVRTFGRREVGPEYNADLNRVQADFVSAAKDFPKLAKQEVIDAVRAVRVKSFDTANAPTVLRQLRQRADMAFDAKDKITGNAYRDLARAFEDEVARKIAEWGDAASPDVIRDFQEARRRIAETYAVQEHLQPSGNVDAVGLGNDLKRAIKEGGDSPMRGDIRKVAEFGANFPKAARLPEKVGGVVTPLGELSLYALGRALTAGSSAGVAGAVAAGHPWLAPLAVLPFARPVVRNMLASDAYQNWMVRPKGPAMSNQLINLQQQPLVPLAETALGQRNQ